MSIKALIPVRSGSLRVQNKNIKAFAGKSLLEWKVLQLLQIKELDGVIVNSNDDEMLDIAKRLGAQAVKRDEYFASNNVSMSEVYVNMAENFDADLVFFADATNPLVNSQTYINGLNKYYEIQNEYDSLNSAHLLREFMIKDNKAFNYDSRKVPRSQDLPDIYALNFAFGITRRENMIANKNVLGANPFIFEIPEDEGWDVDTPFDFDVAEYIFKQRMKI